MSTQKRLLAIQLVGSKEYPSVLYGVRTYRDGLFYVCSHLLSTGLYDIDMCQCYWGDSPLWYDLEQYDAILVSALGHQAVPNRQLLLQLRNNAGPHKPIIMGGPHATFAPHDALRYADFAVIGAGERPAKTLLDMIFSGPYPTPDNLPDRVAMMSEEGVLMIGDLPEHLPPMIAIHPSLYRRCPKLNWATVSFTRGCPYRCSFCYGVRIHGHKLVKKNVDVIVGELDGIYQATGCPHFYVSDLNFGMDKAYTRRIIDNVRGKGYSFVALSRLELGDDLALVDELKDAGFSDFLLGVESIDEDTLSSYEKKTDVHLQSQRIRAFSSRGLAVHGSFVFGADGQTYGDVLRAADWAADHEFSFVCFAIYTDYPHQKRLYGTYQMFPNWRIMQSSPAYQHYSYVSIFPKTMRPSKLQRAVVQANKTFLEKRLSTGERSPRMTRLKMWGRKMKYTMDKMEQYAQYVENVEQPYYNANDELLEERLKSDYYSRIKGEPGHLENIEVVRRATGASV